MKLFSKTIISLLLVLVMLCSVVPFNAFAEEVAVPKASSSCVNGHNYGRKVNSVAHRGYRSEAPENTLPAYTMAKEKGFFYAECDVTYSKDGVPVLLHLENIASTSNGSGKVTELTYSQLLKYDFGSYMGNQFKGTKIPTFEEFIAHCAEIGIHPYIELKDHGSFTQQKIQDLVDILKKYNMLRQCTWITFIHDYLFYVNNCDPYARVALLWPNDVNSSLIKKANSIRTDSNEVFLNVNIENLTASGIQLASKNGYPIEVYTINTEQGILNMPEYISGVTSDCIVAQSVLGEPNCVVTEPTCTNQGYTTYFCVNCGYEYVSDFISPSGHKIVREGYCEYCGAICENGHTYDNNADEDCNVCGIVRKLYEDRLEGCTAYPALASGTVNGNVGIHTLKNCVGSHATRRYTLNTYLVTEVEKITVGADSRIFVQFFSNKGEYIGGSGWQTKGTYTVNELKFATSATYFKVTFSGTKGGNDASVPSDGNLYFKLPHVYSADCDTSCNGCGEIRNAADHTYENYVSNNDATCTKDGTKTGTCVCGDTNTINDKDSKLDHIWGKYVADGNATCTADGTETAKCVNCSATNTIDDIGSKLDHTYENYVSNNDATCTKDGTKTGTCVCGDTNTIDDKDSKLDHIWGKYVADGNATCTADGTKTAKCVNCSATNTIDDIGSKLDHTYENYVSNNDATCSKDGTKTGTCVCGATDTIADKGSKTDHVFNSEDDFWCKNCSFLREFIIDSEELTLVEKDGNKYIYFNGLTVVPGLYKIDGDYYYASWGGKVQTDGKYHIQNTYCDVAVDREFAIGADGKVLNGAVEINGKLYFYVDGRTSVAGLFKDDGNYYVVTWGGKVLTDGKYFVEDSYCDVAAGRDFIVGEDGIVLNGAVEIDGKLYFYDVGRTSVPGLFKDGEDYYVSTWGGVIKTDGKYFVEDSYCDVAAGRDFLIGADGKVLNGAVEIDGKLYFYDVGRTSVPGLFKDGEDYYVATWGGVIKTEGKHFVTDSYCDVAAGRDFIVGEDGKVLNGIVEIDGKLYLYDVGITAAPGIYEVDGKTYEVTWGGRVVSEVA